MFDAGVGVRIARALLVWTLAVSGALTGLAGQGNVAAANPGNPGPPVPKHALLVPNNGKPYGPANKAGYLAGTSDVSPSGAFTYRLGLEVPAGRAGMAPSLALTYSSAGGDGPFGVGWSLAGTGSSIGRCGQYPDTEGTRSGVHFDANDRYCLDGQKLIALGPSEPGASGAYGDHATEYRTENDAFAQIISVNLAGSSATPATGPDRFLVFTKDGRIRTYEARTAPRRAESVSLTESHNMPRPDGECINTTTGYQCETTFYGTPVLQQHSELLPTPPRVVWFLTEEKDRSENAIRYEYDPIGNADGQEYRLGRIRYTFGPNRNAERKVELGYENRPDPSFSYLAGVRFKQTQRVTSISMFAPNPATASLVRRYELSYLPVGPGQRTRSLLWQVRECGALGGCRPAKQFSWAPRAALGFGSLTLGGPGVDTTSMPALAPRLHVQDLDGDGTDDAVYTLGGYGAQQWARLGSRNAAGAVAPLSDARTLNGVGDWPASGAALAGSRPLDLTGDGNTEFVVRTGPPGHDRVLRWNRGTNQFDDTGADLNIDTAWDDFGDVNGDGLLDRLIGVPVVEQGDGDGPHVNWNELRVAVQLNRAGTFDPPVVSEVDGLCPRRVADVDGDGRADLLLDSPFEIPWPAPPSPAQCGLGASTFSAGGDVVKAIQVDDTGQVTATSGRATSGSGATDPALRFPFLNAQRDGRWEMPASPWLPLINEHRNGLYGWTSMLGDFNGDGLRDTLLVPTVKKADGNWERRGAVLWNTGTGLHWDGTMLDLAHDPLADLQVGDINNDGRDDVVSFYNEMLTVSAGQDGELDTPDDRVVFGSTGYDRIAIYLSKGTGQFVNTMLNTTAGTPHQDPRIGRPFSRLGDFDGDGRLDIVKNDGFLTVMTQTPAAPERITGVKDDGAGWQRAVVVYSNAWTDHPELMGQEPPCAAPLICLRRGMTVVRQVTSYENVFTSMDVDDPTTTYFSYGDPVAHARRGFLGFGTVRAWTPSRPAEVITRFDNRTSAGGGKYHPFGSVPQIVTTVVPKLTADQVAQHQPTAQARVTRTANAPEFRTLNGGATYTVFPDKTTTDVWEQPVSIAWQSSLSGTASTVHVGGVPDLTPKYAPRHVEQTFDYDNFGNLEHQTSTTANGSAQQTHYGYDLSEPRRMAWLISLLTTTEVTSTEPAGDPSTVTRRTENHYDDQGRLDTVWVEKNNPDQDLRQTTSYALDAAGVVHTTTITAPSLAPRVSHTEYNPVFSGQPDEDIYPSQLWSEHDQLVNGQHDTVSYRPSTWQAVHPAFGLTVATEDVNGVSTATYHDDLGRPVLATTDQRPTVATSYLPHVNVQGDVSGLVVRNVTYLGPPGTPNANVHVSQAVTDQAGRTRIVQNGGFGGAGITTTSEYDTLGRLASQSRPYHGTTAPGHTTYQYDSLDRPTETTHPNGRKQSWIYTGLDTTDAYDIDGAKTRTTNDVNGRPAMVIRYHNTAPAGAPPAITPIATTFGYGPFDAVRTVTDDHGNTAITGYDTLGRVTSAVDPDRSPAGSGPVTTTYYGTGEVHTVKHSATGNISTHGYDDLGRAISRTDLDGATGQASTTEFEFDTAANGIGQLHRATSPDGIRTTYKYDDHGRRYSTDYAELATGTTFGMTTTYDHYSRPDTLAYPSVPGRNRLTIKNDYSKDGYLETMRDITPNQAPAQLLQVKSRNADLALTAAVIGQPPAAGAPPIAHARGYDDVTGRLETITSTRAGGSTLHHVSYGYYDNGLVHTRVQNDASANRSEAFTHDDLHQLQGWELSNAGGPATVSGYRYDTIGNLTGITGDPARAETRTIGRGDGTLPHAVTARKDETYGYDQHGRLTDIDRVDRGEIVNIAHLTYTAFDLPKTHTTPGGTWTFGYDAFGNRVTKKGPDGGTFYLPGLFERRTAASGQHSYLHYLSGPDGTFGQIQFDGGTSTLQYTLTDALGSTAATADDTGKLAESFFYDPHGERINPDGSAPPAYTGPTTHGFTGQEHDDALGTINMKGRIYHPAAKTFLTPDPVTTNHPYGYVNNTPLNYTDPSGLDGDCFICNDGVTYDGSQYQVPATFAPQPIMSPDVNASIDESGSWVCTPLPAAPCAGSAGDAASDGARYEPTARDAVDQAVAAVVNWWDSPVIPQPTQAQWNNEGFGGAAPAPDGRMTNGEQIFFVGGLIAAGSLALSYAMGPAAGGELLAADALAADGLVTAEAATETVLVARRVFVGEGLTMERTVVEFTVPRGASVTTLAQDRLLPQDLAGLMQSGSWEMIGQLFDEGVYAAGRVGYTADGAAYSTSVRGVFEGAATHLEGSRTAYGILYPVESMEELVVLQSSRTVAEATGMASIVTEGSGNTTWCSCTWMFRD